MSTCEWCGIRPASLLAKAAKPRGRRESLLLCERCWDARWSRDDYLAEPLRGAPRSLVIGRSDPRHRRPSKPEDSPLEAACCGHG